MINLDLTHLSIFRDLPADERARLRESAQVRRIAAGDTLCYAGDPADTLDLLVAGRCMVFPGADVIAPVLLDPAAGLGGLPHTVKITAITESEVWRWPVAALWDSVHFRETARRWLARALLDAQDRRDALAAPVSYQGNSAQVMPGPFMFEDVTLIFAFCDANLDDLRPTLPDGLRIFRRPGRRRDSVLLALADFPVAYSEHAPDIRFGYTETTVFVPVWCGRRIGLFVPYIYPSTYAPILPGREVYGFPKRLGFTALAGRAASLAVDGTDHLALTWESQQASSEPRLVRALMDWLGLEGWSLSVAFRAGDTLRQVMGLPPFRAVSVYNHKHIPGVDSTPDAPTYAVNQITRAIFGVLRWYQIARLDAPALAVTAGPLAGADVRLREAFRTQLDMRLSAGRVVK